MSRLSFFAAQSRACAVNARRYRFMRRDLDRAQWWAERAMASYLMMRCALAEATREP